MYSPFKLDWTSFTPMITRYVLIGVGSGLTALAGAKWLPPETARWLTEPSTATAVTGALVTGATVLWGIARKPSSTALKVAHAVDAAPESQTTVRVTTPEGQPDMVVTKVPSSSGDPIARQFAGK